ncbi:MAG TPA: hypothetical protein VHS96_01625, partial [Bacteroidia bacterium]|nr:hypothetical protein [Bacteroidia bacterium]
LIAAPASALSIYDVSANHAAQEFPGENNGNGYSYDYDIDSGDTDGPLAPFLTTTPSGITATVTWNPTGSLTFTTIYLKAGGGGNSGGGYLVWDVSGVDWSIYDGFSITNTLLTHPKNGQALGISHFNAVGATVPPPPPSVPDTGISAILLGLGMISLGLLRRKRA